MNIVERYSPPEDCIVTGGRQILGVILHDTEGHGEVPTRAEASWHYEIGRLGTIFRYVDEQNIAFHVRAADRSHPDWLPWTTPYYVSIPNTYTIGIELVSDAEYRAAGEPFSDDQYRALAELIQDIQGRYGDIHITTHGALQADRTDPVAFDWGRLYQPPAAAEGDDEMEQLSEGDRAILDLMHGLGANRDSIVEWINQIGAQSQVLDELSAQLTANAGKRVKRVVVEYDDGSTQEAAPTGTAA